MLLLCFACPFNHQELVLLEDDMKALEEMYPQGEQVSEHEILFTLFLLVYCWLNIHHGAGWGYLGFDSSWLHWKTFIWCCRVCVNSCTDFASILVQPICNCLLIATYDLRLIISIAWVAHIVIYLLIDPPLSSFLNEIFVKLDGVWGIFLFITLFWTRPIDDSSLTNILFSVLGLLGTAAFAFFCFYLLIAVIAGEMMLGLKLVFITIHPMKYLTYPMAFPFLCSIFFGIIDNAFFFRWGGTLMNSFLFNVGLILLCSIRCATEASFRCNCLLLLFL